MHITNLPGLTKEALLLFFFSGLLSAQESDSTIYQDTLILHHLKEVVITANRFNTIRMNTAEAIDVLRYGSVQHHQLRTSPEALILTPGVFVQKTNHGGGSPFLRGLTGNQILLLIDGIRLSNATTRYGPNQYLNTIDVFSIERMEILRGSGSVQYGSDAMGGTVQALTHELEVTEKPDWNTRLYSCFATQGMEQSLHASLNYSFNKAAFRAALTWRNFGDVMGGDTTGRQHPTGYRELDYDIKGKILLSPLTELTMVYQSVHQGNVPVYHKVALENYAIYQMDPQERELSYVRIHRKLKKAILKSFTFTASIQKSEEKRENRKTGSSVLRTEIDRVRSLSFSSEWYTSVNNRWSGTSGFEVYNDLVNSTRTDTDLSDNLQVAGRGLYPDGATMTSIAAFTVHTFYLPHWNFATGTRFNTFVIHVADDATGRTKLKPSALVGNGSAMRKLNARSNLFVSLNTGFRTPNIDDLGTLGIVDFRYETPNFDLKPEHSLQYQAGYKYQSQKTKAEIYLYRNELYNLIVRNRIEGDSIEGYPVYQKENTERAFIQGFETTWEYSPHTAWQINGHLTYTYGQNKTIFEPVRRIPPIFGSITLEYKKKDWWMNLHWQAAGKQNRLANGDKDDNRIPDGGTPGWNIINLNAGLKISSVELNIGFKNLFNEDYRFHGSGINGYGRSVFLSIMGDISG